MRTVAAPRTPLTRTAAPQGGRAQATVRQSTRLTRVFRCGLLLIAIHVLDSGLLHIEPGVGPAEHASAVLVPIAAAMLAGWALPHLRPLAQASLGRDVGQFPPP